VVVFPGFSKKLDGVISECGPGWVKKAGLGLAFQRLGLQECLGPTIFQGWFGRAC